MEHMQRNNAKDDAVEGGEDGERPPSSQPIAPATGLAPRPPPVPIRPSILMPRGTFHPRCSGLEVVS